MKQAWYWVKRSVEQKGLFSYSLSLLVSDNATAEFWREVDKDNGYWLSESSLPSERYSAAEREQYYENRMIWLIEKAQQGEAFAQCALADELKWLNDFRELSIENWRVVAWENALYQQAIVATGEPIDGEKLAIFWLTKATEQGLVTAQYSLGFLYYCMDEHEKSVYWLRKYMEGGNNIEYFKAISGFNETDRNDAPKFTFEELEHYRLNNQDSI
jgi:TPR repeat protein